MGIVSIENTARLLWLGRYTERVYTTLRIFGTYFDHLIDGGDESIGEFCSRLDIPNPYTGSRDFVERYCFDKTDPNSIASNLERAYDNAITLREEIGTEAVSYIQLAVYELEKAQGDSAPMMGAQKILDDILAFWGVVDDLIPQENTRNIIKAGKRIERVDLFARMEMPLSDLQREVYRMTDRLGKTNLNYRHENLLSLLDMVRSEPIDWEGIVRTVDTVLEA